MTMRLRINAHMHFAAEEEEVQRMFDETHAGERKIDLVKAQVMEWMEDVTCVVVVSPRDDDGVARGGCT